MKRSRSRSNPTSSKSTRIGIDTNRHLTLDQLKKSEQLFNSDPHNQVIQNSIYLNPLSDVCQNRKYMQKYDRDFSNVIEPALEFTDQSSSGRCWIFAVLNVVRHKMIIELDLEDDFEFSECYLSFWDKMEKCNHFLNEIISNRRLPKLLDNEYIKHLFRSPISDGGGWITCKNLIKKYGLIPKSLFSESYNSNNTDDMNYILELHLRMFAAELIEIRDDHKCYQRKITMMESIYDVVCKLFGSPKLPRDQFKWSYCIGEEKDLAGKIKRQQQNRKNGKYPNLKLKQTMISTPLEFYQKHVPIDCDEMIQLSHDPRNPYYQCYTSEKMDTVSDGESLIYLNLPISELVKFVKNSILNNTPVVITCDVEKHLNINDGLLDTKCYNYCSIFNTDFERMNKADRLKFHQSCATHAMIIIGVDLDDNQNPVKWKIDNSWGEDASDFIMSNQWFENYVFEIIVENQYIDPKTLKIYQQNKDQPIVLPYDDPMVS